MRLHALRQLVDDRPAASCQPACFKLWRTDLMQLVSTDLMQVVSTTRSKSAVGMAALIYGLSRDPRVFAQLRKNTMHNNITIALECICYLAKSY